jgi:hypothetical protein
VFDACAGSVLAEARDRAFEEILIAEGSDWFWWYGDDHSSEHDLEFDDLFRRHLRNVYRLLERPTPDELFVTNISAGPAFSPQVDPTGLIQPTFDGEDSSYFEWLDAGDLEIRDVAGAMHQTDRPDRILTWVKFGFDRDHLYVRLDGSRPMAALFAEGYRFTVTFLEPEGIRLMVAQSEGVIRAAMWDRQAAQDTWVERTFRGQVAADTILEVGVPLADIGTAREAGAVAFVATVCGPDGGEIERHPMARAVRLALPTPDFAARNWTA